MSKKLGSLVIALAILTCSMGLKIALGSNHGGSVLVANGPAPVPPPDKKSGFRIVQSGTPDMVANGPAPVPPPDPKKSGS